MKKHLNLLVICTLIVFTCACLFAGCGKKNGTNSGSGSTTSTGSQAGNTDAGNTANSDNTGNSSFDNESGGVNNSDSDDNSANTAEQKPQMPKTLTDVDSIKTARSIIWNELFEKESQSEARKAEIDNRAMTFGDVSMKFGVQVKGDPDENGYPLFIALHGGGQSDTPDINDSQWRAMSTYFSKYLKFGVYVNPRGVRDTWDCHANPESYPLYDELIENMIFLYNVDPNRVYILGYSAGGDGVYMIAPRMADRFAASNMSAGHPNGTSVVNLYNSPIILQVGEYDSAYGRNTVTAEYDALLVTLQETYGGGYEHKAFIHTGYAHNFIDNSSVPQPVIADNAAWLATGDRTEVKTDTFATRLIGAYTRNPLPEKVVWDLGNRADQRDVESFYWLSAPYTVNEGIFVASYSKADNSITVESSTVNGTITFLINEDMLDVFKPITIKKADGTVVQTVTVTPSIDTIKETTYERCDPNYQFVAKIEYTSH